MESFLKQYCSAEWQEFIDFYKKNVEVKKNKTIFNVGDDTKGLYVVRSGKVKVLTKSIGNEQRLIRLASEGDILGHRGFGGNWTYPITAIALEDTILTFIPLKAFNTITKSNNEFTYQLMMFFAEELRKSEDNSGALPVLNRVAKAIYENYLAFGYDKKDKNKLSFTLSRKDYASMCDTTYESVIRSITALAKNKIINTKNKDIYIVNLAELKKMTEITAENE